MAFGIRRSELKLWKENVDKGKISFLTHYWLDERFPNSNTVTKVGCSDIDKLIAWGKMYGLQEEWIHKRDRFPHFDLFGDPQLYILKAEQKHEQIRRFNLQKG